MSIGLKVGIIGGTGQLGSSMATGWLESGCVEQRNLWISNRSGRSSGFEEWPDVTFTASNQELADACDVILLSVPPALVDTIGINAPDKLVISVMAGVSHKRISDLTGTRKAVRAMSSPAARFRLSYSPWYSTPDLSSGDRDTVQTLLTAIGMTDLLPEESQLEIFTVVSGPVPGFAAYFADCMVQFAVANGVAADVAVRAVKQLFLSSGQVMAAEDHPPSAFVKEMVDYAGTTAAGMVELNKFGVDGLVQQGLEASLNRVRTIAAKT